MARFALTTLAAFLAAMATGTSAVARNDWFGSRDLLPYAVCSTVFALLLAIASTCLGGWTKRLGTRTAAACALVFGALFGFPGTMALSLFLGPWMGSMSVPVLQSWCLTAACILPAAVLVKRRPFSWSLAAELTALAVAGALGMLVFQPAFSLVTGNQHLTVRTYQHIPGDGELDLTDVIQDLDENDQAVLRQTGLQGKLVPLSFLASDSTEWPRANALLVLTGTITETVSLPQPKGCTIAWVQDGNSFRQVREDAPTVAQKIHIEPQGTDLFLTIEQPSGARSGFRVDIR